MFNVLAKDSSHYYSHLGIEQATFTEYLSSRNNIIKSEKILLDKASLA